MGNYFPYNAVSILAAGFLLTGCSIGPFSLEDILTARSRDSNGIQRWNSSQVVNTKEDNEFEVDEIDLDGDRKPDLLATYLICEGERNESYSMVYDANRNIFYVERVVLPKLGEVGGARVVELKTNNSCSAVLARKLRETDVRN
jgi:hypothetical protein